MKCSKPESVQTMKAFLLSKKLAISGLMATRNILFINIAHAAIDIHDIHNKFNLLVMHSIFLQFYLLVRCIYRPQNILSVFPSKKKRKNFT